MENILAIVAAAVRAASDQLPAVAWTELPRGPRAGVADARFFAGLAPGGARWHLACWTDEHGTRADGTVTDGATITRLPPELAARARETAFASCPPGGAL